MSRILVQPVGQKRLTNVAVVRLKKRGLRFEIACYKNKVLSWRSGAEKDLDEVLQSHTVYSNVSKGVLAKAKDLVLAFGLDDPTEVCLRILDKGELQVAGKERESQLSTQFRDIATIVMAKTYNPLTLRPYTISLVERLMRDIHFAVDPNTSSKKQALLLIHQLQARFPIKRSPMRLRLSVPPPSSAVLVDKLRAWDAHIVSQDPSAATLICELDPGFYRDCEGLLATLQGRFEVLMLSVYAEGDTQDHFNDPEPTESDEVELCAKLPKQTLSTCSTYTSSSTSASASAANASAGEGKQSKCTTCNALVGNTKQFREHFKSEWHKHNLRRKTRNLPPLTEDECFSDIDIADSKADLHDYSF